MQTRVLNENKDQPQMMHMSHVDAISPSSKVKWLMHIFLGSLIFLCLVFPQKGNAQISANAQEVWPSIDAYLRLNQKWRLYATTTATKNQSSYADGAIGIFADHFTFPPGFVKNWRPQRTDSLPGKFLWLRFGYQYSATPPSAEDPFSESTIVTEANARSYLPKKTLLTVKNRFDWRFKNQEFNLRYRPRMTVEKDMRTQYLIFTGYVFVEYFGNFGNSQVDKVRTQLGVELRVAKHFNYEVYWNHQFANAPEVSQVDAFGMALKIYYDKNDFKNTPRLKKWFGKKDKSKTVEKQ